MFDILKIDSKIKKTVLDLHEDFIEMGQIKTNFDIEKFTTLKEGTFVASSYHFLMRQYRLYVDQVRVWIIEYERNKRDVVLLEAEQLRRDKGKEYETFSSKTKIDLSEKEHLDLDILQLESRQKGLEIDISGRMRVMAQFERNRQALVDKNGGKAPTNEDFQKEQPEYYEWFLAKKALQEIQERQTGIKAGTIEAVMMACREPLVEGSKMQSKPFLVAENGTIVIKDLHEKSFVNSDGLVSIDEAEKLCQEFLAIHNGSG